MSTASSPVEARLLVLDDVVAELPFEGAEGVWLPPEVLLPEVPGVLGLSG